MKILINNPVFSTLQHESSTKAQPSDPKEFGNILNETLEKTKDAASAPMSTTFVKPMAIVQPAMVPTPDQKFAIDGIERMINILDRYHEKLADPGIDLKKMDSVVQEMSREMENLAPVLDSLPEDGKLKNILNHTLVTTSLELSKFYRGDYIST
jgi:hypothetical protein